MKGRNEGPKGKWPRGRFHVNARNFLINNYVPCDHTPAFKVPTDRLAVRFQARSPVQPESHAHSELWSIKDTQSLSFWRRSSGNSGPLVLPQASATGALAEEQGGGIKPPAYGEEAGHLQYNRLRGTGAGCGPAAAEGAAVEGRAQVTVQRAHVAWELDARPAVSCQRSGKEGLPAEELGRVPRGAEAASLSTEGEQNVGRESAQEETFAVLREISRQISSREAGITRKSGRKTLQ